MKAKKRKKTTPLTASPLGQVIQAMAIMASCRKTLSPKALGDFQAGIKAVRKQFAATQKELGQAYRSVQRELSSIDGEVNRWREQMENDLINLRDELKTMRQRYTSFGKKRAHAATIRSTLRINIRERNWDAATENISALIELYEVTDDAR